jgi:hypothetical protein
MASSKTPSRKQPPAAPGGHALQRTRQFNVSRGLPPPEVSGTPAPEPAPSDAAGKKPAKRPAKR